MDYNVLIWPLLLIRYVNMKKHILSLLLFCTVGIAFAQTSVSGLVRDSNGDVVPGANIVEKGTTNGTVSDFDRY